MTCPNCKCPECRKAGLQSVLARRIVSHETETPRDLSFVERHNAAVLQLASEQSAWRDTVEG